MYWINHELTQKSSRNLLFGPNYSKEVLLRTQGELTLWRVGCTDAAAPGLSFKAEWYITILFILLSYFLPALVYLSIILYPANIVTVRLSLARCTSSPYKRFSLRGPHLSANQKYFMVGRKKNGMIAPHSLFNLILFPALYTRRVRINA